MGTILFIFQILSWIPSETRSFGNPTTHALRPRIEFSENKAL